MNKTRLNAISFLIATTVVGGCGQTPAPAPIRPVKVVRVGDAGELGGKRWFPGRARATLEVNLSFRVSGPLVALPLKVGDRVSKGQLLAQIDPRDFEVRVASAESQVKMAQAQLGAMKTGARPEEIAQLKAGLGKATADHKVAQIEYDREKDLFRSRASSAAELDRAGRRAEATQANLDHATESLRIGENGARKEDLAAKNAEIESLKAAVQEAEHQLDDASLRAPFDGEVAAIYVEKYQNVNAKEPIVRMLDLSHIEMTVDVPETLIHVVPGVKNAVVRFAAFVDREFPAKIKEIGAEASRSTGSFPVTLILDQPPDTRILPGMTGEAQARDALAGSETGDLTVPLTAVFADPGAPKDKAFVWVVDPGKKVVNRRAVTLGQPTRLGVQVKGLAAGEWVASAGVHHLSEGQQVEILKSGVAP
jgi:RND family efflux transporter MFP subunit